MVKARDGGILLGLLIALLAFLGVAWHSRTVYADVQNWKDLGAVVGIGALLGGDHYLVPDQGCRDFVRLA